MTMWMDHRYKYCIRMGLRQICSLFQICQYQIFVFTVAISNNIFVPYIYTQIWSMQYGTCTVWCFNLVQESDVQSFQMEAIDVLAS